MAQQVNITPFVVRNASGDVDVEATVSKFRLTVEAYASGQANDQKVVSGHVLSIFKENPGLTINAAALNSVVLGRLGATSPGQVTAMIARIEAVVDSLCGEWNETAPLRSARGKGGGISLWTTEKRALAKANKEAATAKKAAHGGQAKVSVEETEGDTVVASTEE
jgi:hypothetical protein